MQTAAVEANASQYLKVFVVKGYGPSSDDLHKWIAAPSLEIAERFCNGVVAWESHNNPVEVDDFDELYLVNEAENALDAGIDIVLGIDGSVVAGTL